MAYVERRVSRNQSASMLEVVGWIGLIIAALVLIVLVITAFRVFNIHDGPIVVCNTTNGGSCVDGILNGECNNCLRPIVEQGFANAVNNTNLLNQFLVFGQSTCNAEEGIFNVTSYFPLLIGNYTALSLFDNIRDPRNASDPARTNITYFPAVPLPPPNGTGLGINTPFLVGNVLNHSRFKKFQSVPFTIGFFLNVSFADILPTDERLTVFLKNTEDRGPNNLEHRRYMAALTKSKVVGRYANTIKRFVADLYGSWVISRLPVLSTFKARLIDFFLDIHLGKAKHPRFVKEYFSDFLFFISVTDPNPLHSIRVMKGHMNSRCVREYFEERSTVIVDDTLTNTITWNWIQAGMPIETVMIEAIHNIVAFSQYDNVIHLLVTQSMNTSLTPGTGGNRFVDIFRASAAGGETAQLNVVREFMRIMLPNNLWFSKDVDNNCVGCAAHTQARHIPQLIQVRGEYDRAGLVAPWFDPTAAPNNSTGFVQAQILYATFSTTKYAAFPGRFSDAVFGGNATSPAFDYNDTAAGLSCIVSSFVNSTVDNETPIPSGDVAMIPVFNTSIYAAFGLGARRCPAEIFNQYVIFQLFRAIQCLHFYDDCAANRNPSRCASGLYGPIPLAPFKAVPDSLFVLNYTCPYPNGCIEP